MLGNNILIGASGAGGATGHIIEGSGLFDDGSSGYLTRTPDAGNSKIFTISCVFKRGNLANGIIFAAGDWNVAYGAAYFNGGGQLIFEDYVGSGNFNINLTSTALFRDSSAWYHLVVKYNSTAGTPSASDNGIFINGVQLTDFSRETYPDQGDQSAWNTNVAHRVGWAVNGGSIYYDGYVAQLVHVDGLALNPSSFGELTDDGYWQINDVSDGFDAYNARVNPIMTGNTAPSGTASASTEFNSSYQAWEAFGGGGNSEYWSSTQDSGVGWLQYQFTSGQTIIAYRLQSENSTNTPSHWTLKGSNNGSDFTTLDTQTGISWTGRDYKLFEFSNTTAYTYYRLDITRTGNMTYLEVNSFELLDSTSGFGTNGFLLEGGANVAAGTDSQAGGTPAEQQVVALLHMNGDDASTTFTDSSSYTQTFTAGGNAQIDTAQKKYGTASGLFDGTGDRLVMTADSHFAHGTAWTAEGWFRKTANGNGTEAVYYQGNDHYVFYARAASSTNSGVSFYFNGTTIAGSTSMTDSNWHHWAMVRDGATARAFIDGTSVGTGSPSWATSTATDVVNIGSQNASNYFTGHIDEVRVTTGLARYTGNFTAPSAAFTDPATANHFTKTGTITATNDSPTNGDA